MVTFVDHLHNAVTILLTGPAEIQPWFAYNNVRHQLLPVVTESSVYHWLYSQFSCTSGLTALLI